VTVKTIVAFNTDAKSGTETRRQYDSLKFYDLYSEYDFLKFGKTVKAAYYSNNLFTIVSTDAAALKRLDWVMANVNAKGNDYVKVYGSLSASQKTTYDAIIAADNTFSTTSTKYIIGAALANSDYVARSGLGADLVAQGYTIGDHVQHFVTAADLKKISTKTKTKSAATSLTSAEATLLASINSALVTGSAFNATNVGAAPKTTYYNAFWQLYFNATLDNWTTKAARVAIASPKIAAISSGKFVVKNTAGVIDWTKSGLLIQSYIADTAADAFDVLMSNDWTEAEFEAIFKLVDEIEGRFAVIDTSYLLENNVFTA